MTEKLTKTRTNDPPKCRKCGEHIGGKGTRSLKASERPGVIKRGGKFYHEQCTT